MPRPIAEIVAEVRIRRAIGLPEGTNDDWSTLDLLEARLTELREECDTCKASVVYTVGGTVEGEPTRTYNYLQRLRKLVATEKRAEAADKLLRELVTAKVHGGIMVQIPSDWWKRAEAHLAEGGGE